ncbi:MAG: hypothetical protein CVU38_18195 [Chloroflexi bacterium HGW-Chloroflexi-1]|nr:MAG: hypothetical protein CVU38_18195 [Chloroflexi bacterium HGW-Chloroflexi-1]
MKTVRPRFSFERPARRTKKVTPALIAAIKDRIVRHLHPQKVVLFGSQASGKATPGSDVDLLIVLDDHHALAPLKRRDRFGKLLELFPYRSFGLDAFILIETKIQELQDRNEGEWDLVLEILKKGKVLYDGAAKAQIERAHFLNRTQMTLIPASFGRLRTRIGADEEYKIKISVHQRASAVSAFYPQSGG